MSHEATPDDVRAPGVTPSTEDGRQPLDDLSPLADRSRPKSRRGRALFFGVLIVAAAAVAIWIAKVARKPIPVDVARVEIGTVEQTVSNTRAGTVKARRRARLAPEINGRVVEIPHREGARVETGDLLLRLESSHQRAQASLAAEDVRAAEARAEEACLASSLADTELKRYVALHESGIGSDEGLDSLTNERDRAHAACRALNATLDQARAAERVARVELGRTELRAPFPGVVAEVTTEVGELIASALMVAPVLDLIDPSSIYITAPIDEMDAERVSVGQEVRITVDSRRGESFPGRLVRVAPYVSDVVEQNRTVEVEAELDDPTVAASLLPGTSADVEVILDRRDDALRIPTGAISQGGKVLVVVDGRLEERSIETGLSNWRNTEVRGGLSRGDSIVVSRDAPDVRAGARVTLRESS